MNFPLACSNENVAVDQSLHGCYTHGVFLLLGPESFELSRWNVDHENVATGRSTVEKGTIDRDLCNAKMSSHEVSSSRIRTVIHLTTRLITPVLISVGRIFRFATSSCQNRSVPLEVRPFPSMTRSPLDDLPSGTVELTLIFFRCSQTVGDASTLMLSWAAAHRFFGVNVPHHDGPIVLATQRNEIAIRCGEHQVFDFHLVQDESCVRISTGIIPNDYVSLEIDVIVVNRLASRVNQSHLP